MKGGKFTIHQLMNLFNIFTKGQNYKTMPFNIEILDKNYYLYNNRFHAYVIFNPPPKVINEEFLHSEKFKKDMKSVRIIVIHRGTIQVSGFRTKKRRFDTISRVFGSLKDWTNNLRNVTTFKHDKTPKTYRQEKAKLGHEALFNYLQKLKEENVDSILRSKNYMKLLLFYCLKKKSVSAFLKERLSTLGASQGAVYAYLYGDEGKETIVYNPAPFHGKKPKNTFILKTKNDVVSYFVDNKGLPMTVKHAKKWYNVAENHNNDVLLNDEEKIGDGIFTK